MSEDEIAYRRARERQEFNIAAECTDPQIAAIHREMANRYADLGQEPSPLSLSPPQANVRVPG